MMNNTPPTPEQTPDPKQPSPRSLWLNASMRYGFILGIYMSVQFALLVFYSWGILVSLLSLIMLFMTPLFIFYLGRDFRERFMGGYMGYGDAFRFLESIFLFGLIILTLAYYLGFSHLLNDPMFMNQFKSVIDVFVEQYKGDPEVVTRAQQLMYITPKEMTLQYVYLSFWIGLFLNFILAFFLKKKPNLWSK